MNATTARKLATETIETITLNECEPVADTTIVGLSDSGYWVTDNGEEVSGLTKIQAIEIIVENLANTQDA